MKCSRCSRELTEKQSYIHQGKVMCEDYIIDVGLSTKQCDPWATYVDTANRKRRGLVSTEGLTETQKKLNEYVKGKGKVTRQEAMKYMGLSDKDLDSLLVPLMHSELVKEMGQSGNQYLVPID